MSWTDVQQGRSREFTYLGLLGAGVLVPYAFALPWLAEHGPDLGLFTDELFANSISSFFAWDVVLAVLALVALAALSDDLSPRQRVVVAGGALAGAAVGLPLYLWLRERNLRSRAAGEPAPVAPPEPPRSEPG